MNKIDEIYENLKSVVDPEIGFDIVSLGLIYEVLFDNEKAKIVMTLSTKSCPLHELILTWVNDAVLKTIGVKECEIELVWEPAWSIEMASDYVKKALKV
ncbi:YitW [Campylobacter sputorum subsp. bubulus]|uniref:YitW n=1 Tax=Campylobacter sputorum subsp. sputorum TaxID=32024 RepID=A0A381DI37_9BACT|nr:metal-sulfur cluster assembly factor [Campylobacter sputorum]ASM35406.1 DUF59 domain protein [Campylobacter sputorum aubsp. sputorum RM3237]ASM38773.1 DUF59 domain protein [Campylobacter sputorum bv. paraureolyticus LMG 11764]KAB0582850.1 metal-sulfur cluster assembly factor [Campylobacter sputorum subsp. sputorum]MDY6120575.1 metal-sulfur cluster assembly factor [Campylobacter sputorum]QEL05598.1 DUF59 domain-containing protein [Campylobacter sputorum subsp. sputorum]